VKKDGVDTTQVEGKKYYVYTYNIGANKAAGTVDVDDYFSYTVTDDAGVKTMQCELTLKFNWGTEFKGQNPGLYYDTDVDGKAVPFETVKATLNEFKATLHGITYNAEFEAKSEDEKAAAYAANPIDKYFVIINAEVA
jgi:hypothetical protein